MKKLKNNLAKGIYDSKIKAIIDEILHKMDAKDILYLDVRSLTNITNYQVIATVESSRQAKSIANDLTKIGKQKKIPILGIEGEKEGEWILIDMGDVILHVMLKHIREYYDLEGLWTPHSSR